MYVQGPDGAVHVSALGGIRLASNVRQVRRDRQELDPTALAHGVQLVPTKFLVRPEQILLSGICYGADC